jgi:hypothetical protein
MTKNGRWWLLPILCLTVALAASCAKKAEDSSATTTATETMPVPAGVSVTAVDLGKAVGADKRVTNPTREFAPKDVIYATVLTTGSSPNAMLKAKWSYENGQVVDETEQAIAPNGETATEFHIGSPSGLPGGKYKLEVSLDGQVVQTVEFDVKG